MTKGQLEFDAVVSTDQLNKLLGDLRTGATGAAKAINDALGGSVNKKIVLETVTDASGVKQLVAVEKERLSVADKIKSTQDKINKIEAGSVTSLRQQVNEAKQARDQLVKYEESVGRLGLKIRQLNGDWVVANQRVQEVSRQLDVASASGFWQKAKVGLNAQGLVSFGNGLTQITQALQAGSILIGGFLSQVNNLVTAVAKLETFQLSFVAAGAGGAGGAQALQEASRIALGLGSNLNVVRDGFQKLTPVILNSGGTIGNVSQITQALSSRFAAFGLSADSSRRVMNGVIQAFAKGKLQAEELTQQISEADPAFKTDFANALGVTVQQLEAMVKAGEVTTDVLLQSLPALSKSSLLYGKLGGSATSAVSALGKFDAATGRTAVTTEQVRTQLDTLGQLNFERFATAFQPVIAAFLRAQAVVVDFITYITQLEGIRGLGNVLAAVSQSVINLLDAIARVAGIVATAISPILQFAGAIANSTPGIVILTGLLGAKLIASLSGVAAAILSGLGSFVSLNKVISDLIIKYTGLGTAATASAAKVVASQGAINAATNKAVSAGGKVKQFSLFGDAGDIAGTVGEIQQLELGLGTLNKKAAPLFPTFSKAFQGIQSAIGTAGAAISNLGASAPAALKSVQGASVAAGTAIKAGLGGATNAVVGTLGASLTGLAAVLGPLTAALIILGAAQQGIDAIFSGSKAINDSLKTSLSDINAELAKQGNQVAATGSKWEASVQNVGQASAVYDRIANAINNVTGPLKLATYEEARYNQATIAAAAASEKFGQGLDKLTANYDRLKASSDGSAASQLKVKQAEEGLSKVVTGRINALATQIAAEQALASSSKVVGAAKAQLITVLQGEKTALEAIARARGLETQAQIDQAAIAKQFASEIKVIADQEIEQLRQRQQTIKQVYDAEIQKLDEKKAKIQETRRVESEAANERIRQLRALTPSEQRLEDIRVAKLQRRAAGGNLEAQAQLERLAREKEIAQIEEQERVKNQQAKNQERQIDQEIASQKKQAKEQEVAIDKEIAALQTQIKDAALEAAKASGEFTGQLVAGQTAAEAIRDRFLEIQKIASTVKLGGAAPARFTGGPVSGGSAYTVNELGREMFLSSSGKLSHINAKPWGQWRAPSSGTVIPAHIAAGLDVPSGGVRLSRGESALVDRSLGGRRVNSGSDLAKVAQVIRATIGSNGNGALAATQAAQAAQIGKLTHAVDKLADKNWNVAVNVRGSGQSSYLQAVNRMS